VPMNPEPPVTITRFMIVTRKRAREQRALALLEWLFSQLVHFGQWISGQLEWEFRTEGPYAQNSLPREAMST
jgi:hypothetical protein